MDLTSDNVEKIFMYLGMMGNYEERKVGRWDSEDGLAMVSTAAVNDGRKPFETAVCHPKYNDGKAVIVECYDSKAEALVGHNRWQEMAQSDTLPKTLVDCCNSFVSQLCETVGCDMAFEAENPQ